MIVVCCFCERPDLNLALIIYENPVGQPNSYVHSVSTSFDVGDPEVCLDNPAGCHSPLYFGIPDTLWSGVDVDLSEEPGSSLHFLRDRRIAGNGRVFSAKLPY